jgi:hypothetical protein
MPEGTELHRSLSTSAKHLSHAELEKRAISRNECSICLTESADLVCPCNKHYACEDCFNLYVLSQCEQPLYLLRNREGKISCHVSTQGCESQAFSEKELATHLTTDTFRQWQGSIKRLQEAEIVEEQEKLRPQNRLPSVGETGDGEEDPAILARRAEKLRRRRLHIIETVINLKSSRCKNEW